MAVRKVDFSKFEIQKDPASYNDYAWLGLTLGKLMAIEGALRHMKAEHSLGDLGADCLIQLERIPEIAELTCMRNPQKEATA